VRAEPDGSALVAGTGAPESDIEVLVDGDATLSVTADRAGKFVAFLDLPRDSSGVTISLRMTPVGYSPGEAILSTQDVILAMPTRANAPVASASAEAALSQPGADSAAGVPGAGDAPAAEGVTVTMIEAPAREAAVSAPPMPAPGAAPEGLISSEGIAPSGQLPGGGAAPEAEASTGQVAVPERDDLPAVETAAVGAGVTEVAAAPDAPEAVASGSAPGAVSAPEGEPEGQAAPEIAPVAVAGDPTVLVSGPQGIEALSDAPLPPGDVALDSISYDDAGDVLLAGRGDDASFVRVYLNNAPLATTRIREDGRWRLELPEVDTGTYTLRVDQVTEGGDVTARVESPFRREDPARLERLGADGRPISEITVQPGHTLWAISSARYGEGVQYVRIFEANRDHIRDPDLIYPGQIFDLPDDVAQVGSQ
jgi:nucleoid-associated protein YgaU